MAALLLAPLPAALANVSQSDIEHSVDVAKGWLGLIDAGKYEDSYNAGSMEMHQKETQDHWKTLLKARNESLGKVISRKQLTHVYKPNGDNGLSGECMVLTYETSFTHLAPATEEVKLKWTDGKWSPVGYAVGPKADPDAPAPVQNNTTEVKTQNHVRPQPQAP